MDIRHSAITVIAVVGLSVSIPRSAVAQPSAMPETVMVTYHVKAGSEAALANAITRQWAAANQLKLVLENPHTLVRGDEQGKIYFVEIFTWRDAHIPDAPPAAIQKIWAEMNQLVESRGARPGIDFAAVSVVVP
jgi:hypothetical protein